MQKLLIDGKKTLSGNIVISGSKNATLPILAATILNKETIIKNVPFVNDIFTMVDLLKFIGLNCELSKKNNRIRIINLEKKIKTVAPYKLVKTMRAGILVLGPLLAKYKKAKISLPGGCAIGTRPVDLHLLALKKLGAKIKIKNGYIFASAPKGLRGSTIRFPKISVGATENAIIAAAQAKGSTQIRNCAIEPEIIDLINFLKSGGAKIKFIGKRTVRIEGVKILKSTIYSVMSDRIETGTFCVAACLTGGNLKINNFDPKIIKAELSLLKKVGAKIKTSKNQIHILGPKKIKNITNLVTKEYPNFPTDLQAQFMVLLCKAKGKSSITESIFENRFMHVAELRRLGAEIIIKKNKALILGSTNFKAAELMSSDLRASVALVLAALVAKGTSIINRIYHLDRGYENIENKLRKVGVKIRRIS